MIKNRASAGFTKYDCRDNNREVYTPTYGQISRKANHLIYFGWTIVISFFET